MQIAVQVTMGVSLAACAGLRAFLPLLVMGLLQRAGYANVNATFSFLARTDVLIILAVATTIEILADKIPVVDNFLDTVATFARPAAGALLASSMMTDMDPAMAIILGLMLGSVTALTVHGGKAAMRLTATGTAPAHAGLGNTMLSTAEDFAVAGLIWLTLQAPMVALMVVLGVIALAIWLVLQTARLGVHFLWQMLRPYRSQRMRPPDSRYEGPGKCG